MGKIQYKTIIYKSAKVVSSFQITDFCIAYECNADDDNEIYEWKPIAKGCVCAEEALWNNSLSELELIDSKFDNHKTLKGKRKTDKSENIESMAARLHNLNWYVCYQ